MYISWKVKRGPSEYFLCSCPIGSKKSLCKHSLLAMNLEGLIQFPWVVMAAPLEDRNPPGRKSKGHRQKQINKIVMPLIKKLDFLVNIRPNYSNFSYV